MIKLLLISALIVFTQSFLYRTFQQQRDECKRQYLKSCQFLPIKKGSSLSQAEMECAQDYQKASVCFYYYEQCMPSKQSTEDSQMPQHCWQCYMTEYSGSQLYSNFRECLMELWSSYLFLSFLGLILMLLL